MQAVYLILKATFEHRLNAKPGFAPESTSASGESSAKFKLPSPTLCPTMYAIPIEKLSFSAYRVPVKEGLRASPVAFLSLAHWFEAERFRAFAPDLFQQVLHSPSIKEARKFAKRHQSHTRGDWMAVRARALACGMVYAYWADTDNPRWQDDAGALASHLAALDLPARIVADAAVEFVRLRETPRIAFLGAANSTPDAVGKRVNQVHRKSFGAWHLVHWQGRHSSWQIHDWALQQYIPIRYLGADDDRLNPAMLQMLAGRVSQSVVFESKGGKRMDAVIRSLKSLKVPVDLDLYKDDGLMASLLS